MSTLHRFLIDYDMAMLRAIALNRGLDLTSNRQVAAAGQLATDLLDPLSVRTALARLSPDAQQALDILVAAEGKIHAPHFARRFGQVRAIGSGRLERETPWLKPANPAEELWYAGLIFRAFYQDERGPGQFILIPDDLLPLLPEPQVSPPTFGVSTVPEPPTPGSDELALVQDMFTYLVYLQAHDVQPYANGRLGKRDQQALNHQFTQANDQRLTFLRHLADRLGFTLHKDKLLGLDATPVKRWLSSSEPRQIAILQAAWQDDPTWNDLCHVPDLDCSQDANWQNDPVRTRLSLLNLLACCPTKTWWSLTSFVAAVKETLPDFQRPEGDYTSWYIRQATSGKYLSGFESWNLVEGALIVDLLTRTLRWLGIIVAVKTDDGWICRITEHGSRFLGQIPEEPDEILFPSIIVRPDFRIEIPAPVNLYTRFQLERFASLANAKPCQYRLTVNDLGRALARDVRIEQILAFLRQASDGTIPANVAGQLQMWAGRFGQVQIEEIALLRVKTEKTLRELSALPETRDLIGKVLSPTIALVHKKDIPHLHKALRTLGYLPPEGTSSEPSKRG